MTRTLVGSCSWTDPTLIACGRFYPPGVTSAEERLRYYAHAVPARRGRLDVLRAAVRAQQPPVGRAHARRLHLQRQGVRPADRPPGAHGAPCRPGCARPSAPEALGKRNVYRKDVDDDGGRAPLGGPPVGARAAARRRQARRRPLPVPAVVRARRRQRALPARDPASVCPASPSRSSSAAAAGWTARTRRRLRCACSRTPGSPTSASTSPRASARARRRSSPPPRRSPSSACTGATPTPGRRRPAPASDRFKYLYDDAELAEWVPRVRELEARAGAVHVLFNNNYEDWGMRNARRMTQLLGGAPAGRAGRRRPSGRGTAAESAAMRTRAADGGDARTAASGDAALSLTAPKA